jgi:hypothetical protein
VPHPFRFFLRKGWDAYEFQVDTISENALKALLIKRSPFSGAKYFADDFHPLAHNHFRMCQGKGLVYGTGIRKTRQTRL